MPFFYTFTHVINTNCFKQQMSNNLEHSTDLKTNHAKAYFSLVGLADKIELRVKDSLKSLQITHVQLNVLSILYECTPHTSCISDLKPKLIVNSPDLSRLISRLHDKGLIHRETSKINRRKTSISITKKGVITFLKAHSLAKKSVNNFFIDDLNLSEAKQLHQLLEKINL